jgi:predicted enzyme related to lactoylglutathione lyase
MKLLFASLLIALATTGVTADEAQPTMTVHFLEIVTASVDETCELLAKTHGVTFSEPIAEFGNARTAGLIGGGRISVRAPMRETEGPVVRPYLLVDDINAAVKAAEAAGAEIAIPPMPIPDQGTFAIYILGGIEHGLWQN